MYKYEILIFWSDEDQAFIAEIPELPGCWHTAIQLSKLCQMSKMPLNCGYQQPVNLEMLFPILREGD